MTPLREQPLVLVVDDDAGQRLLTSTALLQGGFSILEAEDGEQALRVFQREQPDIVLLDVIMPGLDGFAVCELLRQQPGGRHLPIIIVTGLEDAESIGRAYQAGATDFITKPIQWLILHHRMRYILRASQASLELRESEERFRTLVQATSSVILVLDREGCVVECNRAAEKFHLFHPGKPVQAEFMGLLPFISDLSTLEESKDYESTIQTLDGDERTLLWNISRFTDAAGLPAGVVIVGQDITARRQVEENMRKLSCAIEQNPISILITDTHGCIEYANPKFTEVSGYTLEEIRSKSPYFLQINTLSTEEYNRLQTIVAAGGVWRGELCNHRKDGESFWESAHVSAIRNPQGKITHFIWLCEDITARRQAEERIRFLAYYDSLTNLPNRIMLQERLQEAIETARLRSRPLAIMLLDLDQFKRVNDSLGHRVGDVLLQQVANRLQECLRYNDRIYLAHPETPLLQDLLARLGGDEFMILLNEINHPDDVTRVAQRILAIMAKPFIIEGIEVFTGCGIGIALYPNHGFDMETLLKNADAALYCAKEQGRNCYEVYSDWMNTAAVQRLELENCLRKAFKNHELTLHYQPQVMLNSGRIIGMEALLRWHSPELGTVSPITFIPVAEETGLIVPIGEWVIRTACTQAKAWQDAGLPSVRMAVNLSPRQIIDPDLPERIVTILQETRLQPNLLELEITESILMKEGVLEILIALKKLGIQLSIDDFGTGYSNFSYLKRFPVDRLKIDRSFIQDIGQKSEDHAIAAAILAMARSLRLGVIAEGVETDFQLDFLQGLGCDEMQGYYFCRPQPSEQIAALLCDYSNVLDGEQQQHPSDARVVVLLDDDPEIVTLLRRALLQFKRRLVVAAAILESLDESMNNLGVVFYSPDFAHADGIGFLTRLRRQHPDVPCIALVRGTASTPKALTGSMISSKVFSKTLVKPLSLYSLVTVLHETFMGPDKVAVGM
ncbi:MAG: EAL domain-containing protein [Candidatus Competibacteraceae bacterium]